MPWNFKTLKLFDKRKGLWYNAKTKIYDYTFLL